MLTRGALSPETLNRIDFTGNKAFPPSKVMEDVTVPITPLSVATLLTSFSEPLPHPPVPVDTAFPPSKVMEDVTVPVTPLPIFSTYIVNKIAGEPLVLGS